jgi:hypothetical protein
MRRITSTAVVLIAVVAGVLVANPAHAAQSAVLTTGSVGGADVAAGDIITSGLKTGTQARLVTEAGGSTGVFCDASQLTSTITSNPPAGGVATESLTAQTFSNCSSNIFGVTGVESVTVNNLPYSTSINGAAGTISLTAPAAAPIDATVRLSTPVGAVSCSFRANGNTLDGTLSNADNSRTFTDQGMTKSGGPVICPGSSAFSATYAPAVDTSVGGSPAVFVQ